MGTISKIIYKSHVVTKDYLNYLDILLINNFVYFMNNFDAR